MFIYRRRAHYHETDQMGIIHHANYIKWMEEARVAFMDDLGFSYKKMEDLGIVSPVTGVTADYKKPVRFDDEVEVRVKITSYNGVRLKLDYEFFDVTTGEVCTAASSGHCFLKDGRLISLKRACPELDAIFGGEV